MLKPIRKPRPFAGARGKGLKELYSATFSALGLMNVQAITHEYNKRYNTCIQAVMAKDENDVATATIDIIYNRQDLVKVFKLAGFTPAIEGQAIDLEHEDIEGLAHPLNVKDLLNLLNGKFKCDLSEDDVTIIANGSRYALTAKADSLGYIGSANLSFGAGEIVISCAGAPHYALIEIEDPEDEENVESPYFSVKVEGVLVYEGDNFNEMRIALLNKGILISIEMPHPEDGEVVIIAH